jgi:glutaminyl-peptide cyclotransferase
VSRRLSAAFVALAIVSASASGSATTPFDSSRAFEHMRQLVAIGPRPSGSAGIQQAREYIEGQLKAIGLTPQEQAFDAQTPFGVVRMANVIARIPGARPERILLTGHFDTKLYRQFRFVGANDGGSSAAMLLELARVLKARKNAYTIEFVFFDGEEAVLPEWGGTDHTYGSRHYVEAAKHDGSIASIKAMILFDMIGDRNLTIRQETKSTPWLTAVVWDSAKRLGHHDAFLDDRFEVEDDHQPFLDAGLPAVDIIDLEYNAWHTAKDTLDEVSARSLQAVGDVFLDALPRIEGKLSK